ncbi:MAG: amidohydrolase family protein [Kordiimonadaceae bacterium]|jgi:imidazolonepropionase-like amidohydrolase|nr:amidohydrolase family protein [Kordiimonadaceae bacterium]
MLKLLLGSLSILHLLLISSAFTQDEIKTTIIHAGTLLAIPGTSPLTNQSIIIENDKITQIIDGFIDPDNAKIIDLKDKFIMPGMMDVHVHIASTIFKPAGYNEANEMLVGIINSRKTLMAGFTTVRDLGADGDTIYKLKDAINKDDIIGPRIFAAGVMLNVGSEGHGNGCNGIESCRKAARDTITGGADVIKIYASCSGRFLCSGRDGDTILMDDEITAIMDVAKKYDIPVAAHAHPEIANQFIVDYNVTSVEHGTFLTDQTIQDMVTQGTFYVPTAALHDLFTHQMKTFEGEQLTHVTSMHDSHPQSIMAAYNAGVKIATGTDANISPHGKNYRELELFSEFGIPNADVLKMATLNSAELLRKESELGSIEIGKIADIIAIDGNPLKDMTDIENVTFVMKSGKQYK